MKNKLKLELNLFDMTDEQIEMSKMMYNDKVIKCLVAPYHSFSEIEESLPYSKTTFVYPENEMNINQIKSFISLLVNNTNIDVNDEIRIVTKNQNIIMDMIDTNVRVLTENGDILDSPIKTMMANIHDIRYKLLENEEHQLSKTESNRTENYINSLITTINDYVDNDKVMTQSEYDSLVDNIDMIGEELIRNTLKDMVKNININTK